LSPIPEQQNPPLFTGMRYPILGVGLGIDFGGLPINEQLAPAFVQRCVTLR